MAPAAATTIAGSFCNLVSAKYCILFLQAATTQLSQQSITSILGAALISVPAHASPSRILRIGPATQPDWIAGAQGTPVRIVCVSSSAHQMGGFDIQDLHFRNRKYGNWKAYAQSKLCNIMFINELARRYKVISHHSAPVCAPCSQGLQTSTCFTDKGARTESVCTSPACLAHTAGDVVIWPLVSAKGHVSFKLPTNSRAD